jgi:PhzF family phenazine biosynthesis protein
LANTRLGFRTPPAAAAQVEAFADGPGSGNPAGVCLLEGAQLSGMTDEVRQKVAEKVNLSETAFLEPVSG